MTTFRVEKLHQTNGLSFYQSHPKFHPPWNLLIEEYHPGVKELKIRVQKIGGIWHGYVEGHPEIDERALTEEIAQRKAREMATRLAEKQSDS
jgi:hypothetical protein